MNKLKSVKTLKPAPLIVSANRPIDHVESEVQMEIELCWCIHQLQNALNSGKLSKKLEEDTLKNMKILKSHTAPLVKKRQVMKAAFGNYRSKMKAEEKKNGLKKKEMKFTPNTEVNKKSNFVKKSAILNSGKGFRFNFEQIETNINEVNSSNPEKSSPEINNELNSNNNSSVFKFTPSPGFKFNFKIDDDEIQSFNLNSLCI